MSHNKVPPRSKPQPPQGISGSSPDLPSRVGNIEKFLREQFDERNQWNAQLREWVGESIRIRLLHGEPVVGKLVWVDRYTLCIEDAGALEIVHKGAVATIKKA